MKKKISPSIDFLEKKIISKENRFKIIKKEKVEIERLFKKENILITGACGSIGVAFTKKILNFNYKNLYLLDKNENSLTGLNREILINYKAPIKKIKFICSDITSLNIDEFLLKNKITIYLNFAAVKHVRSEENLESIKYMFRTNSQKFCPSKKSVLKTFFSVSSDKAVKPNSILGVSKYLMEQNLADFSTKFPKVFVSSARFANVAFSNGSYLEYIKNRIDQKITFGLPTKISRYFITIDEAISICLKSILKKNKNKIIIPSAKLIKKNIKLEVLVKEILNIYGYKIYFTNKILRVNSKYFPVIPNHNNLEGQKNFEEFFDNKEEKPIEDSKDSVTLINLKKKKNTTSIMKKIANVDSKDEIIKYLKKEISSFTTKKKFKIISQII
jgi:FlaA1/EpsC-like NDP-sugar epimerase